MEGEKKMKTNTHGLCSRSVFAYAVCQRLLWRAGVFMCMKHGRFGCGRLGPLILLFFMSCV